MRHLFDVPPQWRAVDLEDSHLPRWRETAEDPETARWLPMHAFTPESLQTLRSLRRGEWADEVAEGMPMAREVVVEDDSGLLLASVVLAGYPCPKDSRTAGVEVSYAVHMSARERGVGTALLRALPSWVQRATGLVHTFGGVCSLNTYSERALNSAGWKKVATAKTCIGSNDQVRHQCANVERKYCSGH